MMNKNSLTITIDEGLCALDASLVINVLQHSLISSRRCEIEKIMVEEFDALGTELPGSFARNTMIQPLQDNTIELFVLLRLECGQMNTPGELMHKFEALLVSHYPDAALCHKGAAVVVEFPEFSFHVVAGFFRQDRGYVVADGKHQQWLKTNPGIHYYALDADNHRHRGLLLPVIRIIKYWNQCNGALFDDYFLVLLDKEILQQNKFNSYVQAIKIIFKNAIALVVFTIDDPADSGSQMEGLKDIEKMIEAMFCFKDCHGYIVQAEKHEKRGDLISAYKIFGKIFAGQFPGYVEMMAKKLDANGITGVEALQIMRDAT
ncbi:MAG: hypothetical protein PF589_09060 [Gammaproteobacteria bacterium]|jgi:hypothetical protein|nr:hypothetical protein [Gammaproteobacteria bacterium]